MIGSVPPTAIAPFHSPPRMSVVCYPTTIPKVYWQFAALGTSFSYPLFHRILLDPLSPKLEPTGVYAQATLERESCRLPAMLSVVSPSRALACGRSYACDSGDDIVSESA